MSNIASDTRNTSNQPSAINNEELSLLLAIPIGMYAISMLSLFLVIASYLSIKKLCTSDAGQMIIIISIAMLLQQTIGNIMLFEAYFSVPLCFVTRFLQVYSSIVYLLLLAAESVNLFVKVGLVFANIDHFPLKASLVALITPFLITGFIFSLAYHDIQNCQARFSDKITITLVTVFGIVILFLWGMFGVIGVMLCKHRYCGNSSAHHESSLKETAKNFMMFATLSVLLGLSNIFTNLIFAVGLFLQQPNTYTLLTITALTMANTQGPALLVFQGVKLKEVRMLWHRWITFLLHHLNWLAIAHSTRITNVDLS